jgi:hypothetical protein
MKLIAAWFAALLLLLVPAALLIWKPEYFTPLVAFLVSMIQLFLALAIGSLQSAEQAKKSANAKWLPPAESACDRLLTVKASVMGLQQQTKEACHEAAADLPELKTEPNKAIRMVFEHNCSEISSRLIDVQNHLEGAFEDWIRFIRQNCEGPECQRIWHSLMARKASLNSTVNTTACAPSAIATQTPANSHSMILVISGAQDGVDGAHTLQQEGLVWKSPRFLLHSSDLGWTVTDLATGESRFTKFVTPKDSSVPGYYQACGACKGGGDATVDEG